jgi:uncharacterized protein (DUF302 family)
MVPNRGAVADRGGKAGRLMAAGIVQRSSRHSFSETVERLRSALKAKGITLFAEVDHSGEAEKVGLRMPPTKLFIFGNPKAGTPVMLASPSSAIDLPLKILVAQDEEGKVSVSFNSAEYLGERHNVPQELVPSLAAVEALAAAISD